MKKQYFYPQTQQITVCSSKMLCSSPDVDDRVLDPWDAI